MLPQQALLQQALHCRRAWQAGAVPGARACLKTRSDAEARVWERVLNREHPLACWLDGEEPLEALPLEFPEGSSPRQLFSSHPFTGWHAWSKPLTFPESSWMPPVS